MSEIVSNSMIPALVPQFTYTMLLTLNLYGVVHVVVFPASLSWRQVASELVVLPLCTSVSASVVAHFEAPTGSELSVPERFAASNLHCETADLLCLSVSYTQKRTWVIPSA